MELKFLKIVIIIPPMCLLHHFELFQSSCLIFFIFDKTNFGWCFAYLRSEGSPEKSIAISSLEINQVRLRRCFLILFCSAVHAFTFDHLSLDIIHQSYLTNIRLGFTHDQNFWSYFRSCLSYGLIHAGLKGLFTFLDNLSVLGLWRA